MSFIDSKKVSGVQLPAELNTSNLQCLLAKRCESHDYLAKKAKKLDSIVPLRSNNLAASKLKAIPKKVAMKNRLMPFPEPSLLPICREVVGKLEKETGTELFEPLFVATGKRNGLYECGKAPDGRNLHPGVSVEKPLIKKSRSKKACSSRLDLKQNELCASSNIAFSSNDTASWSFVPKVTKKRINSHSKNMFQSKTFLLENNQCQKQLSEDNSQGPNAAEMKRKNQNLSALRMERISNNSERGNFAHLKNSLYNEHDLEQNETFLGQQNGTIVGKVRAKLPSSIRLKKSAGSKTAANVQVLASHTKTNKVARMKMSRNKLLQKLRPADLCASEGKEILHSKSAQQLLDVLLHEHQQQVFEVSSESDAESSINDDDNCPSIEAWPELENFSSDEEACDNIVTTMRSVRDARLSELRSRLCLNVSLLEKSNQAHRSAVPRQFELFDHLLSAAEQDSASAASALMLATELRSSTCRPKTRDISSRSKRQARHLKQCLFSSDSTRCTGTALPFSNNCIKHIMYNVDQQLFEFCTARTAHGVQCCVPVFDPRHDMPLCAQHAVSMEHRAPINGCLAIVKKAAKRSSRKKRRHKRKAPVNSSMCSNDHIPLIRIKLEDNNLLEAGEKFVQQSVAQQSEKGRLQSQVNCDVDNLDLPISKEADHKLLEDHVINEVLQRLPDSFHFSGKNGTFLSSKEDVDALASIFAEVQDSGFLSGQPALEDDAMRVDFGDDFLVNGLGDSVDVLMDDGALIEQGGLMEEVGEHMLHESELSSLASSFSLNDMKQLSTVLTPAMIDSMLMHDDRMALVNSSHDTMVSPVKQTSQSKWPSLSVSIAVHPSETIHYRSGLPRMSESGISPVKTCLVASSVSASMQAATSAASSMAARLVEKVSNVAVSSSCGRPLATDTLLNKSSLHLGRVSANANLLFAPSTANDKLGLNMKKANKTSISEQTAEAVFPMAAASNRPLNIDPALRATLLSADDVNKFLSVRNQNFVKTGLRFQNAAQMSSVTNLPALNKSFTSKSSVISSFSKMTSISEPSLRVTVGEVRSTLVSFAPSLSTPTSGQVLNHQTVMPATCSSCVMSAVQPIMSATEVKATLLSSSRPTTMSLSGLLSTLCSNITCNNSNGTTCVIVPSMAGADQTKRGLMACDNPNLVLALGQSYQQQSQQSQYFLTPVHNIPGLGFVYPLQQSILNNNTLLNTLAVSGVDAPMATNGITPITAKGLVNNAVNRASKGINNVITGMSDKVTLEDMKLGTVVTSNASTCPAIASLSRRQSK